MTASITTNNARRLEGMLSVGRWTVRVWLDASSPWRDDRLKGFSLTKILATLGMLVTCYSIVMSPTHAITLNHLWMTFGSYACAFGKSTFNFLLTKMQYSATRNESDAREDKRAVTESHSTSESTRREFIEAHYTVDGVAKQSLPAQPEARTLSGDE